jgi:hypothetical protein
MRLFKAIFVIFILYCAMQATAQIQGDKKMNQLDSKGARNGMWFVSIEPRMGEPGYTEFGNYQHGRKTGAWYKLDGEGDLMAMENFKNNTLDGEVKYFDKGHLTTIGHYRGLNPEYTYDTFIVVHPITGAEELKAVSTERGSLRHGMWRYYDSETGRLIREEDYQVDEMIYSKEFALTKSDSLYYQKRTLSLPHNKKTHYYEPPATKKTSYSGY